MQKSEIKKLSVEHILSLIYNNQVRETAIYDLSKEKLADFVIDHFNRKHLDECYLKELI